MVQSLIQVYDSKIYESNHKIDMLKESQKDLIKTFEKLEQSNDNLRQLIGEKCQSKITLLESKDPLDNIGNSYLKLEIFDMRSRKEQLAEQNQSYQEECSSMKLDENKFTEEQQRLQE